MDAFAELRGVTVQAAYQAAREGRFSVGSDGLVDPELAARDWERNTHPRRGGRRDGAGRKSKGGAIESKTTAAVDRPGVPPGDRAGEVVDLHEAVRRKEVALAARAELEVLRLRGDLMAAARRVVAEGAARDRSHWEQFPDRYFATIFAAITASPTADALRRSLEDAIREHLAKVALVQGGADAKAAC